MGQSGQEIRNAIQRGEISAAIEKVNDLNPEILDTNPQLFFHLQKAVTLSHTHARGARTHTPIFAQLPPNVPTEAAARRYPRALQICHNFSLCMEYTARSSSRGCM